MIYLVLVIVIGTGVAVSSDDIVPNSRTGESIETTSSFNSVTDNDDELAISTTLEELYSEPIESITEEDAEEKQVPSNDEIPVDQNTDDISTTAEPDNDQPVQDDYEGVNWIDSTEEPVPEEALPSEESDGQTSSASEDQDIPEQSTLPEDRSQEIQEDGLSGLDYHAPIDTQVVQEPPVRINLGAQLLAEVRGRLRRILGWMPPRKILSLVLKANAVFWAIYLTSMLAFVIVVPSLGAPAVANSFV